MPHVAIDHRGMDKELGHVDQFPELEAIIDAIFSKVRYFSLPHGKRCRTKVMAGGNCFGVDYHYRRYVEQNPTKRSPEAARARAGSRIVWVIQTHDDKTGDPLSPNRWVGKVEDNFVRVR